MKDCVAIVTGGSRGIGRAVATKLASEGAKVVISYLGGEAAANETVKLCEELGAECVAVKANVADSNECDMLVNAAKEKFGRVDILVNNAGITKDGLAARMSNEDFDAVIDTNLKGAFYMMRACGKLMMKQRYGRIVNIASVVGRIGNAGQINYVASKAGVIGMTKTMARELASRNVTANAVAPGFIETDMTAVLSEDVISMMKANIPTGTLGSVNDVANAVAFLAKKESGYITGQTLSVDGGMTML